MGLRVLSLFDGIACGMQAFKELEIPIDAYYASEIEKNAIKVATSNHPEIVEIGDVTEINFNNYIGKVDIIIGGSPCQGFPLWENSWHSSMKDPLSLNTSLEQ